MQISKQAASVIEICTARGVKIATAESCTGGLIAAALTEIAGASAVFECGFVTYSNASKSKMLGVPEELIAQHGAVSAEVAAAMASGAREMAGVDMAVAVTGIAGPSGGTAQKPVGLVYIALAIASEVTVEKHNFTGNRAEIRQSTVFSALNMLALNMKT